MDHKLLIILNKADQFEKIHDFARAYGSLCWNLSKVIPRKDLPRIYTMCLPVAENKQHSENAAIPAALQDLHSAREEVVAEVRKAPARRMDNLITQLSDAVRQLHMHAVILQDIRSRWSRLYWQGKWAQLGVASTGGSLTAALAMYGGGLVPVEVTGAVLGLTVLLTGGMNWYHNTQMKEWERIAITPEELSAAFQRTHARAIAQADEYVAALWQRIRDPLMAALEQETISKLGTVTQSDLDYLQSILKDEIPKLRRQIAPATTQ
jgi:hypothetical protein